MMSSVWSWPDMMSSVFHEMLVIHDLQETIHGDFRTYITCAGPCDEFAYIHASAARFTILDPALRLVQALAQRPLRHVGLHA